MLLGLPSPSGLSNVSMTDEQSYSRTSKMTRGDSREVASSGVARNSRQLNSAINDANNGGDSSSDAGDASTGGNNMRNQDSSRCDTAYSRVEQQVQKLHALQPWLD